VDLVKFVGWFNVFFSGSNCRSNQKAVRLKSLVQILSAIYKDYMECNEIYFLFLIIKKRFYFAQLCEKELILRSIFSVSISWVFPIQIFQTKVK